MRHRKSGRKLGRNQSHRDAMFSNMASSLLSEEKIQTTTAKAKELRRVAERLITVAKRSTATPAEQSAEATSTRLSGIRQAARTLRDRGVLQKLFGELAERYRGRPGGYTRIIKVGRRAGDGAEVAIIELVQDEPAQA